MKAPRFFKSGAPSHVSSDPTSQQQSSADLLKWISDVTIKRRQIRRSTHCSNLFAEAILSSALRQAKRNLAHKQEEKRKRLRLFCLNRSKSNDISVDNDFELVKNPFPQKQVLGELKNTNNTYSKKSKTENSSSTSYKVTVSSYVLKDSIHDGSSNCEDLDSEMTDADDDVEVKACLSSLENFFKELKSIKVKT